MAPSRSSRRPREQRSEGGRSVVSVGVRPRPGVPHHERSIPTTTHPLRRGEDVQRGPVAHFHAMRGLDYVALRYFNVYGPRMDIHGLYTEVLSAGWSGSRRRSRR